MTPIQAATSIVSLIVIIFNIWLLYKMKKNRERSMYRMKLLSRNKEALNKLVEESGGSK